MDQETSTLINGEEGKEIEEKKEIKEEKREEGKEIKEKKESKEEKTNTINLVKPINKEIGIKIISGFPTSFIAIIHVIVIFFAMIIFFFKRIIIFTFSSNKKEIVQKNLTYYHNIQNKFCDNIRYEFNREIEDMIMLYNVSLNGTSFEMFIYKELDYISEQMQINQSYQGEATLHMLNAIKYYGDKYNIKNEEMVVVDIGANVGWFTMIFGIHNYSVLSFEPYFDHFYILKKNYCRLIKNYYRRNTTVTLVNKALYQTEELCGFYQDIKSSKKDLVICDLKKERYFDIDYMRMARVNSTRLDTFFPFYKNKKLILLRFDLEFEGENAFQSGREIITLYRVPYIFIEYNPLIFNIHKTTAEEFLQYFVNYGYKISLNGFLTNKFVDIDDVLEIRDVRINLYLVAT